MWLLVGSDTLISEMSSFRYQKMAVEGILGLFATSFRVHKLRRHGYLVGSSPFEKRLIDEEDEVQVLFTQWIHN